MNEGNAGEESKAGMEQYGKCKAAKMHDPD
jgi:hypothetical protein